MSFPSLALKPHPAGVLSATKALLWSAVLVVALAFPAFARDLVLVGPPWPPYLDPDQEHKGFASEIVIAALNAAGHDNITIRLEPWRRVLWNAHNKTVDGLIGIWHTPEREAMVAFSKPYFVSPIVAILPTGTALEPRYPVDLAGLEVAYRAGARFGPGFDDVAELFTKTPVGTTENVVRMVAQDRVDAGMEDGLVAKAFMEANSASLSKVRLSSAALLTQPLHFGAVKGKPHTESLIADFNRGLDIILGNGRYHEIVNAYRPGSY